MPRKRRVSRSSIAPGGGAPGVVGPPLHRQGPLTDLRHHHVDIQGCRTHRSAPEALEGDEGHQNGVESPPPWPAGCPMLPRSGESQAGGLANCTRAEPSPWDHGSRRQVYSRPPTRASRTSPRAGSLDAETGEWRREILRRMHRQVARPSRTAACRARTKTPLPPMFRQRGGEAVALGPERHSLGDQAGVCDQQHPAHSRCLPESQRAGPGGDTQPPRLLRFRRPGGGGVRCRRARGEHRPAAHSHRRGRHPSGARWARVGPC